VIVAVIRKRKTKKGIVYDVDFRFKGRRHILSTRSGDLSIAKKIRDDIQGKIARGTFNLDDYEKKTIRLSQFFQDYFDFAKSFKKDSTIYNERRYAQQFIAFAGDIDLRNLSNPRLLDQWHMNLSSKVSPATFNIHRRFLHAAFNVAIKWEYLDTNPMAFVQKAKPVEKRLFMTEKEVAKIFELIESDLKTLRVHRHLAFLRKFRLLLVFLLSTGLRRKEAIKLNISDVDLTRNLIHIKEEKTNRTRILPMNRTARMVIETVGGEMFASINPDHASRKFGNYVERAELEGFKLHSLRHTFATNLIAAGSDLYTVSRLLGHSDIRTSMIYAKASVDVLKRAVDQLESSTNVRLLVEGKSEAVENPLPRAAVA
jgi:site-specific recombinase XerD